MKRGHFAWPTQFGDRLRYLTDLVDATRRKDRNKLRKLRQRPMPPRRPITPSEAEFLGIHSEEPEKKDKPKRQKPVA